MDVDHLALDLAVTIRHDGHDGIADGLAESAGLTAWVREHALALAGHGFTVSGGEFTADEAALGAVVTVRTAVRALFGRAVLPGPPSAADAGRLPSAEESLHRLNAASALVPVVPRLDWLPETAPTARCAVPGPLAAPAAPTADRLAAALARAAIAFLAGPDREKLRACPAPRCVRYFVKQHALQEWCKPSCGNRARVARHHARRRAAVPAVADRPGPTPSGLG
ncbi:ABATE domain-containing protein [Actinacidiphila sp. ITFR-21]|uniref:ABATE domain-containing protein n=1 Tax=Actinacidiphila sp. ITFR-21 TaxID=3075199 RepID=UPI00288A3EFE|nr:ABATE domain-containing protein [Streptomyces sp. ITFR-21]WNI19307.1 ABATE domain-containing protein [Streptomyces sp. ITFR-21]